MRRDQVAAPLAAGRYELVGLLGRGATGAVYRAHDRQRDLTVALKMLRESRAEALYRFKQEFRTLAEVSHPNLVELYDLLHDGTGWMLAMELLVGRELLDVLRPSACGASQGDADDTAMHTMATDEAPSTGSAVTEWTVSDCTPSAPLKEYSTVTEAFVQLFRGLGALHRMGHVHCDLKPTNVLMTDEGRVVLVDFGLVQASREDGSVPFAGTPAYMAPEQLARRAVLPASDMFAAGLMLYEALTGHRPFVGSISAVTEARASGSFDGVRTHVQDVPAELVTLCHRLLAPDAAKRPTALQALKLLGASQGIEASGVVSTPATRDVEASGTRSGGSSEYALVDELVGRDDELAQLFSEMGRAQSTSGRMVLVHAVSGTGKTVLVDAFTEHCKRTLGATLLAGRCYQRERVPFKGVDTIVDALTEHVLSLPADARAVCQVPHLDALVQLFPVLRRVREFDEAASGALPVREEAYDARRRAFESLRLLLTSLCAMRPLVLSIDDVHWGDEDSAALLTHLFQSAPRGLLCVGTYRSEEADDSAFLRALGKRDLPVARLEVGPLDDAAIEQLALRQLASVDLPASHAPLLVKEAAGSAYFVGELVRYLHQTRQSNTAVEKISLDQVIVQRVHALPENERALLEWIVVAGRPTPRDVLMALYDRQTQRDPVKALRVAHLVNVRTIGDTEWIEPYHDRVRESVGQDLEPTHRTGLHAQFAEILISREDAEPDAIAAHLSAGGQGPRAARYFVLAADAALKVWAFDNAASHLARALECEGHDAAETRDIKARRGELLAQLGRASEAASVFEGLLEEANVSGDDREQRIWLARRVAEERLRGAEIERGRVAMGEALAQVGGAEPRFPMLAIVGSRIDVGLRGFRFTPRAPAEVPKHVRQRVEMYFSSSVVHSMNDFVLGTAFQARYRRDALRAGLREHVAISMCMEGIFQAIKDGVGGAVAARRFAEQAMACVTETADEEALGIVYGMIALIEFQLTNWAAAVSLSRRSVALLRRTGRSAWFANTAAAYAVWAKYQLGELKSLAQEVDELRERSEAQGDRFLLESLQTGAPGMAALVRDEPERVREFLDEHPRDIPAGYRLQDYWWFLSQVNLALYQGRGRSVIDACPAELRRLKGAMMPHMQLVRNEAYDMFARVELAAARDRRDVKAAIGRARGYARKIKTKTPYAMTWRALIEAGASYREGDVARAARDLRRAEVLATQANCHAIAAVARYRFGQVVGGDEGGQAMRSALAFFDAQTVAAPLRYIDMLSPGFDSP